MIYSSDYTFFKLNIFKTLFSSPFSRCFAKSLRQVKILYVRNLMLHTTEDTIQGVFDKVTEGGVERVKKLRDFAFVHFRTVEEAHNALQQLDGQYNRVQLGPPSCA